MQRKINIHNARNFKKQLVLVCYCLHNDAENVFIYIKQQEVNDTIKIVARSESQNEEKLRRAGEIRY